MRGKRSKAYRKLLKQFELAFNFRQPFQVIVDADFVADAHRFAMDLPQYLRNTLHGEVKVLVTQCSMRHLYSRGKEPGMDKAIDKAKEFERRRCGHHPEEYPEPLSTLDCLSSVVGPTNKHRYVVASQDGGVRAYLRGVPGVPLVYISRSVMILEPMAAATTRIVQKGERAKFRAELKEPSTPAGHKRKRDDDDDEGNSDHDRDGENKDAEPKKKKKRKGLKGPNPLAVKKPKKKSEQQQVAKPREEKLKEDGASEQPAKKRKRKSKKTDTGEGGDAQQAASVVADE